MSTLKISDPFALQFLMTDDLYSIHADVIPELSETREVATTVIKALNTDTIEPTPAIITIPAEKTETPGPAIVKTESPSFYEYLGENNKYILILFNDPAHKTIVPKELETLSNILKGKKQDIKDVALVNLSSYPTATFSSLKEFFACNSIVLFGINPAQLKIEGVQANQITSYQGTKILSTFSIAEMLSNVEKKRAFWDEMKKL
ncbi:hypothetical protein WG906_15340 [Pedobacter sp. P351]|uniref:hypothetical protein n=1 Tax=Pedobacter superstes TaxID=3133441 RepID=UPI0030AF9CEB